METDLQSTAARAPSDVQTASAAAGLDARPVPVIEMEEVDVPSLRSPRQLALTEVNWTARSGDFWVMAGLHGSGKSDFAAMAAGILPPRRGRLRLFGQELKPGFETQRVGIQRRLGLVFNEGRLLKDLTVAENVSLPLRYHRNCRLEHCGERVEALLAWTGLMPWAMHRPGSLFPNQRQRADLARALALGPEVLILDSPLNGLDPYDAAWWTNAISELAAGRAPIQDRPLTLIVTADDVRPWQPIARAFAILKEKRLTVVDTATPAIEALSRRPENTAPRADANAHF